MMGGDACVALVGVCHAKMLHIGPVSAMWGRLRRPGRGMPRITRSIVDTVIKVKGAEAAQERSSRHLWEGERRIIVRLMFPDPIDDM